MAEVVQLQPWEADRAGALIARAFNDDPLVVHILPDSDRRRAVAAAHFTPVVRLGLLTGEGWRTADFDAAATWAQPGAWPAPADAVAESGLMEIPSVVGQDAWERFLEVYIVIDERHAALELGPHWLLQLIGVEPERQGGGRGSAVIRPGLERADEAGELCYLETLLERNVPFYERHGFAVVVDEVEPRSGLRFWCMAREPAGR